MMESDQSKTPEMTLSVVMSLRLEHKLLPESCDSFDNGGGSRTIQRSESLNFAVNVDV